MKKYLASIGISLFLWSCTEEVSKDINTDLTQESAQFFKVSEAINESNYLGNLTFSEYLTISSAELPGCPTILHDPSSRIIELVYDPASECPQENKTPRTGKITLDFTLSDTATPSWRLIYENYTFGGSQITGFREFQGLSSAENRENFENLTVELENELSFVADGTLTYSLIRSGGVPFALTTQGRVEGRNPAGRNFSIFVTGAKEQLFQCYRQGWELPQKGKESWVVSRSSSTSLDYEVSFQTAEGCDPVVISTLPDGRTLQMNP